MVIGTYILIIILNVSGLNVSPKDTDWLNGYKKTPKDMLSTRDPLQT